MADSILGTGVGIGLGVGDEVKKRKKRAPLGEFTQDELKVIRIVEAFGALKEKPLLPPDLDLAKLTAHVADIKGTRKADSAALSRRKKATQSLDEAEKAAKAALRRGELWLDGVLPAGRVGRIDFFPVGPGPHTEGARLSAFLQGLAQHAEWAKLLPPGFKVKDVTAVRDGLESAVKERQAASQQKNEAGVPKANTSATTSALLGQLTDFVRAWFGEDSAELVQFGVNPRRARK